MGDSAYECLLKMYLQTNSTEPFLLTSYLGSASAIIENLLCLSESRSLLYVTDVDRGQHSGRLEHLACFLPGLLALGVHRVPSSSFPAYPSADMHMAAAQGLGKTCRLVYVESPLGLAADEIQFPMSQKKGRKQKPPRSWALEYSSWKEDTSQPHDAPPGTGFPKLHSGGREYSARRASYLLRPEVRSASNSSSTCDADYLRRPSKVCTCCGEPRMMRSGGTLGGPYFKLSNGRRA
jgi:mannosyl-oligosaccharide alpha-1,2-mannosidase